MKRDSTHPTTKVDTTVVNIFLLFTLSTTRYICTIKIFDITHTQQHIYYNDLFFIAYPTVSRDSAMLRSLCKTLYKLNKSANVK